MPRTGICCAVDGAHVDDHECLRCKMAGCDRVATPCSLSYEMLKGMMDGSGRASAHTSATMLTSSCPRRTVLERDQLYHANPLRLFPAWRGTMGHLMTERHPQPGCIYEQRFETQIEVDGCLHKVTGQIDKLNIARREIEDFKTKDDQKLGRLKSAEDAHVLQLNIYRWLVYVGWPQKKLSCQETSFKPGIPAEIEIETLKLTYWSMKSPKPLSAPLMDLEEIEAYVVERVRLLHRDELPGVPVDLDPERSKLCLDWCPVRDHCMQRLYGF